jgi:hypothetical protein
MKALRRRIAKLGALLSGLCLLWACNAPSIPVPPPALAVAFASQQAVAPDGGTSTVWTATQSNPIPLAASARFYLYDLNRGTGIIQIANPDGTFVTAPMEGDAGDRISIYYETSDGDLSDSVCLLLADGPAAMRCPE